MTYSATRTLAQYGVTVNAISPAASTSAVPTERRRARTDTDDERSPDNVAPVVAYLASPESGRITGRIVHSAGYEIALYNNPEPIARIIGTEPWGLDDLAAQVEPLLGKKG